MRNRSNGMDVIAFWNGLSGATTSSLSEAGHVLELSVKGMIVLGFVLGAEIEDEDTRWAYYGDTVLVTRVGEDGHECVD